MVIDALMILAALHAQPHYRDFNPGLGVEVELAREPFLDSATATIAPYVGVAAYRDSNAAMAQVGGIGLRVDTGTPRWHAGGDLLWGYAHTASEPGIERTGPVIQPSLYLGYRAVSAHVAAVATDAVGFYLRYEMSTP